MLRKRIIIMGAAGRDFHNFNIYFRENDQFEVIAFTATQIPYIEKRVYPPELAGDFYPDGIPIYSEDRLEELILKHRIDTVVFSYSDVSHEYVMNRASRVLASGANFILLSPEKTSLESKLPVVSICAVRTGSGKSATTRHVVRILREFGKRVSVIRHPMPYGDLSKQRVQRFVTLKDLDRYECTIEEREEYEPHIRSGVPVFAGVDYVEVLKWAEEDGDVIVWDGGNNDFPFIKSDLRIVLVDPHRPGHEIRYHPGETNLRMADVIIISKVRTAPEGGVRTVRKNIIENNPDAMLIEGDLEISIEGGDIKQLKGKKVVVIEDGPTLTHGGMGVGAGIIIAERGGAEVIDPRPYLEGSFKEVFSIYPHIGPLIPAMGYSMEQIKDMEATINRIPADLVLVATPVDLRSILDIERQILRVSYEFIQVSGSPLDEIIRDRLSL